MFRLSDHVEVMEVDVLSVDKHRLCSTPPTSSPLETPPSISVRTLTPPSSFVDPVHTKSQTPKRLASAVWTSLENSPGQFSGKNGEEDEEMDDLEYSQESMSPLKEDGEEAFSTLQLVTEERAVSDDVIQFEKLFGAWLGTSVQEDPDWVTSSSKVCCHYEHFIPMS
jgi:hypothetical protein